MNRQQINTVNSSCYSFSYLQKSIRTAFKTERKEGREEERKKIEEDAQKSSGAKVEGSEEEREEGRK